MIKISVRNLVEFILRSGDIDNTGSGASDAELMRMGTKLHKKIQKSMGINYSSEYPLSHTFTLSRDGMDFEICVDGRADGIIKPDESQSALKSYIEIDGEVEINGDEGGVTPEVEASPQAHLEVRIELVSKMLVDRNVEVVVLYDSE